jgi:hypothetical protein
MCASPQRFSTNRITLTSSGFALNLGKFSADAQLHNKCKGYQSKSLSPSLSKRRGSTKPPILIIEFLQQETRAV